MKKLLSIIGKNLKLLLRSKVSALIILFGPLIIILVVGLAFNSSGVAKISIGYYSPLYNNLTKSFVEVIGQSNYSLHEFGSVEECKASLGSGKTHLCISFPDDFRIDNTKINEIDFFVDNSKINLYQSVVDSIESDFNRHALKLSTGMTTELIEKLNQTTGEIYDKTQTIIDLKKQNADTKSDIEAIESELKSMNLGFEYDSFGVDSIKDTAGDMTDQLEDVQSVANELIIKARRIIADFEDFADDINMSSNEEDELDLLLNESGKNINSLESSLSRPASEIKSSTKQIEELVTALSSNLRQLGLRLESAAKSKDAASQKAVLLKERIAESEKKILIVEGTFNAITSNIMSTEVTNVETIVSPIKKNVRPVVTEESQLNFYFPYLIILIIMFIGILLSSTVVMMEKTSTAYFRNFVTPTKDTSFILGTYFTTMIVMVVQVLVLLSIYVFFSEKNLLPDLGALLLILLLATTFFTFLGMIIGNLLNSEETGMLTSISLASLMLFISDLIFPLERMPEQIAKYASYNPFVICSELLRKVMVHGAAIPEIKEQLIVLGIFVVVASLIVVVSYKYVKRHFLLAFAGYLARKDLRKKIKQQNSKKLYDMMNSLPRDQYFVTKNNKRIANIKELYEFIEKLGDDELVYYVDKEKNILADWVSHSLKNEALAIRMYKAKTKEKILKVIENMIDEFENVEQEMKKAEKESALKAAKEAAEKEKNDRENEKEDLKKKEK